METGPARSISILVLVLVTVGLVAYFVLQGNPIGNGGMLSSAQMPDASHLGLLANENGTTVGYIGHEDGTFERMAPLPEGETLVSMAWGGKKVFVLTENISIGDSAVYEYVDETYAPRYRGVGLSDFLEISPDGTRVGFVSEREGISRAYTFILDANIPKPVDLGAATQLRFFTHEETPGVWLVNGTTLSMRVFSGSEWSEPTEVFKGESPLGTFALNGASRFVYLNVDNGATEEQAIDSLIPFVASSRGTYGLPPYSDLFFWGSDFYALRVDRNADGSAVESATLYPLAAPENKSVYPIARAIPGVIAVLGLNP